MNKLDTHEWKMLKGTALMSDLIRSKVPVYYESEFSGKSEIYDLLEKVAKDLYYVRSVNPLCDIIYFSNPIDRSRVMEEMYRAQMTVSFTEIEPEKSPQ